MPESSEKEASKRGGAREGAGRPKIMKVRGRVELNLDAAHIKRIDKLAAKLGISRNALIRQALSEFEARH